MNKKFFVVILIAMWAGKISAMDGELTSSSSEKPESSPESSEESAKDSSNDEQSSGYSSSGGSSRSRLRRQSMLNELSSELLPVVKTDDVVKLYFGRKQKCNPVFLTLLSGNIQSLRTKDRSTYEKILTVIKKYRADESKFSSEFFSSLNNEDKNLLLDVLINPAYDSVKKKQYEELKYSRNYRNIVCGLNILKFYLI
jgi:hypothetical protein